MKKLVVFTTLALILKLHSQIRSAESSIKDNKRDTATFIRKQGIREITMPMDRQTEESFQRLFYEAQNLVNFSCDHPKDKNKTKNKTENIDLKSLSCSQVPDKKGILRDTISFPGCKRKGNGQFTYTPTPGKEPVSTEEPPVIVKSNYDADNQISVFKPLAAYNYSRKDRDGVTVYEANKTPVGSTKFSLPYSDVKNICKALKDFNPAEARNPIENKTSIYDLVLKLDKASEWRLFTELKFSIKDEDKENPPLEPITEPASTSGQSDRRGNGSGHPDDPRTKYKNH